MSLGETPLYVLRARQVTPGRRLREQRRYPAFRVGCWQDLIARNGFLWKLPLAGGQTLVELMLSLVSLLCLILLVGQMLRAPHSGASAVAARVRDLVSGWRNPSNLPRGLGSLLGLTPYRVVAAVRSQEISARGSAVPGFTSSARLASGDSLVPPFGGPRLGT